jgi:hypothetical protein
LFREIRGAKFPKQRHLFREIRGAKFPKQRHLFREFRSADFPKPRNFQMIERGFKLICVKSFL